MIISLRKPKCLAKGAFALVAGAAFLASAAMPARAGMGPGNALFGSYESGQSGILTSSSAHSLAGSTGSVSTDPADPETAVGDATLRLIDPVGNANFSLGPVVNECAMIYVFDDDEEMGECCGCPITPAGMNTFSFQANLLSNWGGGNVATGDGMIAVRAATINNTKCTEFGFPTATNPACNGGCDPTTGYDVNGPLLGSIVEPVEITTSGVGSQSDVVEIPLFSDASGDVTNNHYLITQCIALVGNGSGTGICNCPTGSSSGL